MNILQHGLQVHHKHNKNMNLNFKKMDSLIQYGMNNEIMKMNYDTSRFNTNVFQLSIQ